MRAHLLALVLLAACGRGLGEDGEEAPDDNDIDVYTHDGGQCRFPLVFEPDQDELDTDKPHYAPFSFTSCTWVGSAFHEPWCSSGPAGAFTGSWGMCYPTDLIEQEAADHSFFFRGERSGILVTDSEYALTSGWTFELWVRTAGLNEAHTVQQIILASHESIRIGVTGIRDELFFTADGLVKPHPWGPSTPLTGKQKTGMELELGLWTHLALTYDGILVSMYADGRLVSERSATGRINPGMGYLSLGGDWQARVATFHGAVDEVRVWGQARSHREVVGNMLTGITEMDVWRHGLLAYWPMMQADAEDPSKAVANVVAPSRLAPIDDPFWPPPPEMQFKVLRSYINNQNGVDDGEGDDAPADGPADASGPGGEQGGALWAGGAGAGALEGGVDRGGDRMLPGEEEVDDLFGSGGARPPREDTGGRRRRRRRLRDEPDEVAVEADVGEAGPTGVFGPGQIYADAPQHLEALGGSKAQPVPLARALGGTELVFTGGWADTHAVAPATGKHLHLNNQGTIEAWVEPMERNAQNHPFMIIAAKPGSYEVGVNAHTMTLWYRLAGRRNSRGEQARSKHTLDACRLRAYRWSHVAFAFDRSSMSVYIDGVQCAEDPEARGGGLPKNTEGLEVGGSMLEPDAAFAGAIDELRVWNAKREAPELESLMFDSLRADWHHDDRTDNLLASWSFDEGSGYSAAAAHGVGKADEAEEERRLVLVGNRFDWRLASSPAALIIGSSLDRRPVRFAAIFAGVHAASLRAPLNRAPIPYGVEFCFETWFVWHGPNDDKSDRQMIAFDAGFFALGLGNTKHPHLDPTLVFQIGAHPVELDLGLKRGVWCHVALSKTAGRGGDGVELTVNGAPYPLAGPDRQAPEHQGGRGHHALILGNDASNARPLRGALHEVRLWAKARSAQEVRAHLLSRLILDDDDDAHVLSRGATDEELHAYWPLDEGHGRVTVDRSGQGNFLEMAVGTGKGPGVGWAQSTSPIARGADNRFAAGFGLGLGNCGGANGASHVSVPGSKSLHMRGGMTVEMWVNLNSEIDPLEAPPSGHHFPHQPMEEPKSRRRVVASRSGVFSFGIDESNELFLTVLDSEHHRLSAPQHLHQYDMPYNVWTHVAFSANSSGAVLMLNGAVAMEAAHHMGFPREHEHVPLIFGAADEGATGSVSDAFCGSLDEVRVWNKYRSAADLRAAYLATVMPPYKNRLDKGEHERLPESISAKDGDLVLSFSMDSGWGRMLYDQTDNGNNGIVDGPTVPVRTANFIAPGPGTHTPPHQWLLSKVPADDANNGLSSMGFSLRLNGHSGESARCRKGLRDAVGGGTGELTVQAWVKYYGPNHHMQPMAVLHEEGSLSLFIERDDELSWAFAGVSVDTRKLADLAANGVKPLRRSQDRVLTGVHLDPSDEWRHVALVLWGRNVQLYVDARIVYTMPVNGKFQPRDNSRVGLGVQIGGAMPNEQATFHGELDEVAIWKEARTQAQITTEHLSLMGMQPRKEPADSKAPKKLVAYWAFNDGWGQDIADEAKHGYDCTMDWNPTWKHSGVPPPGEERMCTKDEVRCEPAFSYGGETYYGCTGDHNGGKPWCYTDEKRRIWQECDKPCSLLPHGGFPGHFTSVGRHGGWWRWVVGILGALLGCCCCAGGAVIIRQRRSGHGGRCPSYFDVRDTLEDWLEGCLDAMPSFRKPARAPVSRPPGAGGFGGGFGGTGNGPSAYGRNYDNMGSEGAHHKGSACAEQSRAEGGVRSSIASRGGGGAAGPGAFQQFDDDML